MDKHSTGSEILNKLLNGGYERQVVTTIYGPAGCGKTLLLMLAMAQVEKDKKIIYIDTEGGFSTERFSQVCPDYEAVLDRTIFLNPTNFEEQKKAISELKSLMKMDLGLIAVDTFSSLYRVQINSEDNYDLNKELAKQLRDLVEMSRKKDIPVICTGQVYSDLENKDVYKVVGGAIVRNMSKCLLELRKEEGPKRKLIIKKHRAIEAEKSSEFEIVMEGIN